MADCFTLIAFLMSYDRLILVFCVLWIFLVVSWASLQCVIVVYHDRIKTDISNMIYLFQKWLAFKGISNYMVQYMP